MRIIHLSTAKSWRGGEQQIAYLVTELDKKKIQQVVFCPEETPLASFCKENTIGTQHLWGKSKMNQAKFLAKWCKLNAPTLIHTHDAHAHTIAVLSSVFFGNQTPMVISRRVDFPVKNNFLSKYKYNYKSIERIICVSEEVKRITSSSIKDKSKLVVVHSGIDTSKFAKKKDTGILKKEFGISPQHILIGNVSALADHKDYVTFLETAKVLLQSRADIHFFLIGKESDAEDEILEWLEQHQDIQSHFTLTGFRSDIPQILPELDVFLFTSKTEGLGTSVLDAFASGVPVVATRAGGIPESVIHEQTGMLAPIGEAQTLASHVIEMLENDTLRKSLIKKAKQHLQNFTKEKMADKTLAIYRDLHI